MRVILYTGKGGVGKTSISAATAILLAERGLRTIVLSTDPAHSLADSFGVKIGGEPVSIAPNLWAMEIDVNLEIKRNWETIRRYLVNVLNSQGMDEITAEELLMFPGIDDLFSLLKIREFYDSGGYDVAIIDCAPSGNTARMLSIPEAIRWYMEKYFHIEKKVITAIKPIAEKISKVPMPDEEIFSSLEDLYRKVDSLREILLDQDLTSIRLVANPEKMVLEESQRALSYFHLFGMQVDLLIINKVFPEEAGNGYFREWVERQKEYLREAKETFSPLPILIAPYFQNEVVNYDALKRLGEAIFGNDDPSKLFFRERPFEVSKDDGFVIMKIHLPDVDKSDISLWRKGEEVAIKLRNFQRNITLPRSLAIRDLVRARYEDGYLKLFFK